MQLAFNLDASGHLGEVERTDDPSTLVPVGQEPSSCDVYALPTEAKVRRAKDAIGHVFELGHPTAVAYSAGKDSTILLYLVLEVARERRAQGLPLPTILVTHAQTKVDNPAYEQVANGEIQRVRAYSAVHGLPVRVDIAEPSLNDSWAVRIISGRALPTFANSTSRDCSISLKLLPQQRQRKLALKELSAIGEPVVMVGTRFDESVHRNAAMAARGERDSEIWVQEIRNGTGKLLREELRLSPICHFSQEDVWVLLAEMQTGERQSFTDAKAIWEAYRDGGGSSCAVVSDDALKAAAKACGARFGCWSCAAVGRDRSLEAMVESDPKYEFMRGLNCLQRFIVDTQYDMSRRQWVGRTITQDGFIAIGPDAYSAEMQRDLLRYALTLDKLERRAAAVLRISPRFEIVSLRQLVAIDIIWAMQGHQPRPYEAMHVYMDVNEKGGNYFPPSVDASRFEKKVPKSKWLYVGRDYDSDDGNSDMYTGARNLMADVVGSSGSGGCAANTTLGNGRIVMDVDRTPFFEVDEEGAGLFLEWEIYESRLHERTQHLSPGEAFRHYQLLGTFSTSMRHLGDQDYMLRRADWKRRHGVFAMSTEQLLSRSVTDAERAAGLKSPAGFSLLSDDYQASLKAAHARRESRRRKAPATACGLTAEA